MLASHARGYRFGTAYSVVVPDGELGSTHVSQMIPLRKRWFEDAKALGWSLDEVMQEPWYVPAILQLLPDAEFAFRQKGWRPAHERVLQIAMMEQEGLVPSDAKARRLVARIREYVEKGE